MKYYIDYNKANGKILGFLSENNKAQCKGILKEVDIETYNKGKGKNKIIIDNDSISFENFDFRTQDEIKKAEILIKLQESQKYLDDTDFKMLVDYFSTLEESKKQELISKRAEARDYIRANEQ